MMPGSPNGRPGAGWPAWATLALAIAGAAGCDGSGGERGAATGATAERNREAVIPPQCYTRTEERFNPCYTCHQTYPDRDRPNVMADGYLQGDYAFSDFGMTNRWSNLFRDRSEAVAAVSDREILDYIGQDNYTPLADRLASTGWSGFVPDLENLHLGHEAFDEHGFARDGSGWVAFNYKPLPSTFWPTNGSTDDVMLRLPARFRTSSCQGESSPSIDAYRANLAILEAAIQDLPAVDSLPVDERAICTDLDGDGVLRTVDRVVRPSHYVGDASSVPVEVMLYPEGIQFLHTVRYVGVSEEGEIGPSTRLKELRYMRKLRSYDRAQLRSLYGNEHQEKREGKLPKAVDTGHGLDNGFGWLVLGFIEDEQGALRPQSREEQMFCMGCHTTVGTSIDQTFAFPRKLPGAEGWGYLDLRGMPDAPNQGETDGEILTYLERVGGGSEFRNNREMQERWFTATGEVDRRKVEAADVHALITPSPERALRLNKAYRLIVEEQSFTQGRDAVVTPPENVYDQVDPQAVPLPASHRYDWDIRLDWR